ncbi:Hpt domain-containing protein [Marinobacter salinisoli]|uniref:Hpt domain-containing protein n=1 Tax=Marinobacter salinisoli TaxID=2769486 RepID=A0ABX7MQC2_9GAMM|nr:Hpt domain-containing protein [Marinobacter salinisoli]QSP94403.1 Hpt domain-containing protein [Marinobacter salinisoli]
MNETPHIDQEALAELQDVMDDEFGVLIETFLKDSRERIAGLRQALNGQDADALAQMAHSFKGSCINIGAPRLGALCQIVEKAGKEQRLDDAPATVDAIEAEFRSVSDILEVFVP